MRGRIVDGQSPGRCYNQPFLIGGHNGQISQSTHRLVMLEFERGSEMAGILARLSTNPQLPPDSAM
jgi:hypothetical protein